MVQNEMIEVRIKSERSQNIIQIESKSMQVDVKRNMYCWFKMDVLLNKIIKAKMNLQIWQLCDFVLM